MDLKTILQGFAVFEKEMKDLGVECSVTMTVTFPEPKEKE